VTFVGSRDISEPSKTDHDSGLNAVPSQDEVAEETGLLAEGMSGGGTVATLGYRNPKAAGGEE
jgi:hypothetical protein